MSETPTGVAVNSVSIWDWSAAEVGVASTELAAMHAACPSDMEENELLIHCMLNVLDSPTCVNAVRKRRSAQTS